MASGFNRRDFLKAGSAVTAGTFIVDGLKTHLLAAEEPPAAPIAANDQIQIALIGAGGQGSGDTRTALLVPGVKLVAVADCYDGRLARAKEIWGNDIFTTRDYKEILSRSRRRRSPDRHSRSLAQTGGCRRDECGQGRLLRKAHDTRLPGWSGDHCHGEEDAAHYSDRQPARQFADL